MIFHLAVTGVLIIFSALYRPKEGNISKHSPILKASFLLFTVIVSFRSLNVGNDTSEYFRTFNIISSQNSLSDAIALSRYETGYVVLNYFIGKAFGSFTVLLIVISSLYFYASYRLIIRYAKSELICILLSFSTSFVYSAMNLERQCVAISLFLLAIPYLVEKKKVKYILLILLALMFHSTALVLLPIAFLPKLNLSEKRIRTKWVMGSVIALFTFNLFYQRILTILPYYSHYLEESKYSIGGIRSASIGFFLLRFVSYLMLLYFGAFRQRETKFTAENDIFSKMLFFDILISTLSIGFNLYDRIEHFFTLGFIIAVDNGVNAIKKNNNPKTSFICSTLIILAFYSYLTLTLLYRPEWTGIIPYHFIWS